MEYESCDYEWDDVLDDCCDFLNRPIKQGLIHPKPEKTYFECDTSATFFPP